MHGDLIVIGFSGFPPARERQKGVFIEIETIYLLTVKLAMIVRVIDLAEVNLPQDHLLHIIN
jgi:hypothetical protein